MADALPMVRDGCWGYPMALALIGANLKTGAREEKCKQIAEKFEHVKDLTLAVESLQLNYLILASNHYERYEFSYSCDT